MPIYEYRCDGCEAIYEEWNRSGDDGAACPRCGHRERTRIPSRFAVTLETRDAGGGATRSSGCCGGGSCGCRGS